MPLGLARCVALCSRSSSQVKSLSVQQLQSGQLSGLTALASNSPLFGNTKAAHHLVSHHLCGGQARACSMATNSQGNRRVAVAQMTSVGDQEANFAVCQRLAEDAAQQGCKMLFLPECCSFIGTSQRESVEMAQPLDGPAMRRFRDLARQTQLWLSLGGFQETGPDPDHLYNCHVILDEQGDTRAAYRKIHLFDVEVHNGPILMESRSTAPGHEVVACDSPVGRLGVTVCYDLRFPELYQALRFDHGADVMLVPSAFTKLTGEAHWELLLRARAVETQAYVIAAAQAGRHNEKRESYGHSIIIDPWGDVVARLADPLATGLAVADIDMARLQSIRERMPIAAHRAKARLLWAES